MSMTTTEQQEMNARFAELQREAARACSPLAEHGVRGIVGGIHYSIDQSMDGNTTSFTCKDCTDEVVGRTLRGERQWALPANLAWHTMWHELNS